MAAGQHREGYRRPRTGEKRHTRRPLRLDRLAEEVREAILKARAEGKTWEETSELASKAAGEPIAMSVCHRWYDLRIEQVQKEVLAQAERARGIAAAFAGRNFERLPDSVRNALSAAVFALAEEQDEATRDKFLRRLADLGWLLAKHRQLDISAEKVDVERKKLEAVVNKVKGLKQTAGKKKVSAAELQRKIDELYGIATQTV